MLFKNDTPREHELAVLKYIYEAVTFGEFFDIGSKIECVVVRWTDRCSYHLELHYRTWALPRLWDRPKIEGLDDRGNIVLKAEFEMLFGIPLGINFIAEKIGRNRECQVPVELRLVGGNDFNRRPPLIPEYIQERECKGAIQLPRDLFDFLTTSQSRALSRAICPLSLDELIEDKGEKYYRIFNGGLKMDLLIPLDRPGSSRAPFSRVCMADNEKQELGPYAESLNDCINRFYPLFGNFLYIQ